MDAGALSRRWGLRRSKAKTSPKIAAPMKLASVYSSVRASPCSSCGKYRGQSTWKTVIANIMFLLEASGAGGALLASDRGRFPVGGTIGAAALLGHPGRRLEELVGIATPFRHQFFHGAVGIHVVDGL